MQKFEEKKFNIPELKGISTKNIEEHLKLYAGYVKNSNHVLERIEEFSKDSEKYAYELGELQRRFSFEFNGMRNHEYYFTSFEGGAKDLPDTSELKSALEEEFGSFDAWLARFKAIAKTRGIGWAVLAVDQDTGRLVNAWIDEQHLGQLNGASWVLGIDMWEHAFVYDYATSEKGKYIEAFFNNLNWGTIEKNYLTAIK